MTTSSRIGYDTNAVTYKEEMDGKGFLNRSLVWLGETLDRLIRDPNAPIFPKDAPLRQGNCGVVGVCMLLDQPYTTVAPVIAKAAFGNNKRKIANWSGASRLEDRDQAIAALGFKTTELQAGKRLGDYADSTKGQKGRAMVRIQGHVVVVWDGLIFDQSFPAGATSDEHFASASRTTNITALT